ncbi:MAG: flippase [candidate division KSB1 bacterium]|nr:flippase [candidate division KSB1 bacterium]
MLKSLFRLVKHSAIYGVGHILSRFIGFLLLPIHTNYILPDEYGVYVLGYAFIPFAAIFYSFGINSAQLRFYINAEEKAEKDRIFGTSFLATLFISTAFSLSLLIFSDQVSGLVFGSTNHADLVRLSAGILTFDALSLLLFNILRAEEKSVQFIVYSTVNILLNITLNIILIVGLNKGIDGIFTANLVASVVTCLILAFTNISAFKTTFSRQTLAELFNFGLPIIPSTLAMIILTVIDRFIIKKILGNEAVGIYGAGYKLGMFMSLLVTGFRYAWFPFSLSTASEDDAKEIFAKVLTYFIFICTAVFLAISLFIPEIIRFKIFGLTLFGEEYWTSASIVPLILASYIFYGIYLNFQIGVYLNNKTTYLMLSGGAGAILNVALNYILIPRMGIMGAAYATLVSYVFMAFLFYAMAKHLYPVKYEWWRIIKVMVTGFLLFVMGTLSYAELSLLHRTGIFIAYFPVLYFIGFFDKREISVLANYIRRHTWQN